MKRCVKASYAVEDVLSDHEKKSLEGELLDIVKNYFDNYEWRQGRPGPIGKITFIEGEGYEFRAEGRIPSQKVRYAIDDQDLLNDFKTEVKVWLRAYAFRNVSFDIEAHRFIYEHEGETKPSHLYELKSIHFN